ncbi:MAG: hypothetical protein ACXWL2_01010 [Candidatus Chromulinivorax sp.]
MNTKIIIASILLLAYHSFNHGSEKKQISFARIHKIITFEKFDGPAYELWYDKEDELEARKEVEKEKTLENQTSNISDQLQNVSISEKNTAQEILPIKPKPIKKAFFGFGTEN